MSFLCFYIDFDRAIYYLDILVDLEYALSACGILPGAKKNFLVRYLISLWTVTSIFFSLKYYLFYYIINMNIVYC
jgi:hypothetical protein